MEKITTDVLIIGGGLAAMTAALEASESPCSILVVSKSKVGNSGATLMAGSNFAGDLLQLEGVGVKFLMSGGRFDIRKPPGHRNARTVFTYNSGFPINIRGKTITEPLKHAIEKKAVRVLDGVLIYNPSICNVIKNK